MGTICLTALSLLPIAAAAQPPRARPPVEEIFILRSVRLSRQAPSDFCGASGLGVTTPVAEDRYEFRAVATDAATGRVTSVNGARVGTLQACLGTTADARVGDFHAWGEVGGMPLLARGQCRVTGEGVPEAGLTLYAGQFDLSGLPPEYVDGRLTTNTVQGRTPVGANSDPPGYTQPSIATIRLWKKR
ncbi:hypothetical protein TBR22_A15740 [Luteitalea sp. TBR-22]|uniref:hypothetical protein n=1 Tax=Luteitalea sp. TBR-22 TaxID=2802971 RepID=UPI001AF07AE8|nr:hypothetical protein [Luteitalea sp. TBR-22]BCS32364.1 hypothetical protein TBR22_A15740 [Luteitalea sp. TBR-22]